MLDVRMPERLYIIMSSADITMTLLLCFNIVSVDLSTLGAVQQKSAIEGSWLQMMKLQPLCAVEICCPYINPKINTVDCSRCCQYITTVFTTLTPSEMHKRDRIDAGQVLVTGRCIWWCHMMHTCILIKLPQSETLRQFMVASMCVKLKRDAWKSCFTWLCK